MRLVEFLIYMLEAQAETLKRLSALLGEETLMEILEAAGEAAGETADGTAESVAPTVSEKVIALFESPGAAFGGSAYQELEGAVQELNLPEVLQFHLWAYPHYRAFIESPLELDSRIPGPGAEAGAALVEEAVQQAQAWVHGLHLPPQISQQVERAAYVPWLRFRTEVLKRIGRRPLGPVY